MFLLTTPVLPPSPFSLHSLVAGDVNGEVGKLYKRVKSILKKAGTFDALLCSGSFFAPDGTADATWAAMIAGTEQGWCQFECA